jgi:hypothetical protein
VFTIGGVRNSALEAAQIKRRMYEKALERWQYMLDNNELSDDDYNMATTLVETLLADLDRTQDDIRHIMGEDD